jgi:exonuclease III
VEGKGGGLALFVSDSVSLNLFSFGPHHIDTAVTDQDGNKARYTFVYGEPKPTCRLDFWKLLKRIRDRSQEPWFIVGDFNEAMFQSEHWSATRRSEARMRDFRDTLEYCNLHDLGYVGCPWTFDNNQSGRKNVRVRLDRAVACPSWSQLYPQATVQHLVSSRSDHCPIVISLVSDLNRASS